MKYTIALIAVIMLHSPFSHAQELERGTGYWRDGVVTHNGSTAMVASNEPRPLRQVVESLSEEYGWVIDYEDPIYSDAETVDRTEPVFVANHPGVRRHLLGGHKFESQFSEVSKTGPSDTEKKSALQKVVADFNSSGNPGQFTVVDEGAGRFAIVGRENGTSRTILDTPITVNIVQVNGAFALDAFSQALTAASGMKVVTLTYPLNLFVQTIYTKSASNQPARDVLREIVDATHRKVMWSLLYDIDGKAYYLNLALVVKATTDMTGRKKLEVVR